MCILLRRTHPLKLIINDLQPTPTPRWFENLQSFVLVNFHFQFETIKIARPMQAMHNRALRSGSGKFEIPGVDDFRAVFWQCACPMQSYRFQFFHRHLLHPQSSSISFLFDSYFFVRSHDRNTSSYMLTYSWKCNSFQYALSAQPVITSWYANTIWIIVRSTHFGAHSELRRSNKNMCRHKCWLRENASNIFIEW